MLQQSWNRSRWSRVCLQMPTDILKLSMEGKTGSLCSEGSLPCSSRFDDGTTRLGAFFTEADVDATAPVCVLGQTVVDNLFGNEDPIGKTIRVHSMPCKVAGGLQAKGFSATGQDQDDFIVMPFTTGQKRITGTFWLDDIFCSAVSREAMPEATKQIVALLRERHHLNPTEADDFNIRRPEDVVQAQLATSDAFAATSAAASAARCTSPFATYKVTTSIAKAAIASRVTIVRATRTMVCPCSPECVAIALFLMNSFLSWSSAHWIEKDRGSVISVQEQCVDSLRYFSYGNYSDFLQRICVNGRYRSRSRVRNVDNLTVWCKRDPLRHGAGW